jgi:hypothetical protein
MFYGLDSAKQRILGHALGIIDNLFKRTFHADHLVTVERCMGFFDDERFMDSFRRIARTAQEKSLVWRLHVQAWAAAHCLHLDGDFVECGVYQWFCSHFVVDLLDFAACGKTFFLYDTFEGIPPQHRHGSPVRPDGYRQPGLYEQVRARFAPFANVKVIRGVVPDVLETDCPGRVAYLHLDMNSASAETAALEHLFNRMTAGGMIVLDDYGWQSYRAQKTAEDAFFAARGHSVLELPTGQGLLVRR